MERIIHKKGEDRGKYETNFKEDYKAKAREEKRRKENKVVIFLLIIF